MKLSDFTKPAPPVSGLAGPGVSPSSPQEPVLAETEAPQEEQIPGQMTLEECISESAAEGPEYFTSVTPSGIEVAYSPAPRRHYKLRERVSPDSKFVKWDWQEVPSVTNVLGVLEKPQLVWWGMKVGVDGLTQLVHDGLVHPYLYTTDQLVAMLTEHKLTVNHQRDKAADRGVNVHGALEAWAESRDWPEPREGEQGYFDGLSLALNALGSAEDIQTELMVGSLQHSYAGRFDLVLTLSKPVEVVTKVYPKRKPRIEEIPAGRYLLDLKTSKGIYNTHYLQLEAYEAAAVECGYQPTDHRGVIHVTADGRYELALNKDWTFDDFLAVRKCYQVMNERSVVQALRDDLDAKDASLGDAA